MCFCLNYYTLIPAISKAAPTIKFHPVTRAASVTDNPTQQYSAIVIEFCFKKIAKQK